MEETMKRIMKLGSLILMLMTIAVLGARGYNNGRRPYHNPDSTPPNHSYNHQQNDIREFSGYLVVNERDIKYNRNLGFHINLNPFHITNIYFTEGRPQRNTYGIVVRKPNGDYTYLRFDRRGNQLAQNLFSHRWRNRKGIYVEVKGKVDMRDRTIAVFSLEKANNHQYNYPGGNNNHDWDDNGNHPRG